MPEIITTYTQPKTKRISTVRYYVSEIATVLSGFALIAIMYVAIYVLTAPIQ